jgi:hypothetical protein
MSVIWQADQISNLNGSNGSNPSAPGGEIFATWLHLSGSIERLVWSSQFEKSKVSNQPLRVIHGVKSYDWFRPRHDFHTSQLLATLPSTPTPPDWRRMGSTGAIPTG